MIENKLNLGFQLFPNGIRKEDGIVKLSFSIYIGFCELNTETKGASQNIFFDENVFKEVRQLCFDTLKNSEIQFIKDGFIYSEEDLGFQDLELKILKEKFWSQLFNISNWDNLKNRKYSVFDTTGTASEPKRDFLFSSVEEFKNREFSEDPLLRINDTLERVDKLEEKSKGDYKPNSNSATSNSTSLLNLNEILSELSEHPKVLRETTGNLIDFQIELNNRLIGFNGEVRLKVNEQFKADAQVFSFDKSNLLSKISDYKIEKVNDSKYYHGPIGYGILDFSNHKIISHNRELLLNEVEIDLRSSNQTTDDNKRELIYSNNLKNVSESQTGVYLYHDIKIEEVFENLFTKEGTLGQNVLVGVGEEKAITSFYSLFSSKTDYSIRYIENNKQKATDKFHVEYEDRWQFADSRLEQENSKKELTSNLFFSWSGGNALFKGDLKYFRNKGSELTTEGKVKESNTFGFLTKRIKVSHKPIVGTSIDFIPKNKYSFFFTDVLVNGWTLLTKNTPISKDRTDVEASIEDLFDDNNVSKRRINVDFRDISEPIGSTDILGVQDYEDFAIKKGSDSHIVKSGVRSIWPPAISFEDLKQQGYLTVSKLSSNDKVSKATFVKRCEYYFHLEKSFGEPDLRKKDKNVKYLSDPRGTDLLLTPGEWRTNNMLEHFHVPTQELFEGFFHYSDDWNIYKKTKRGRFYLNKQRIKKSKNSIYRTLEKGFEMALNFHLLGSGKDKNQKLLDEIKNNSLEVEGSSVDGYKHLFSRYPPTELRCSYPAKSQKQECVFKTHLAQRPKNIEDREFFYAEFETNADPCRSQFLMRLRRKEYLDDGYTIVDNENRRQVSKPNDFLVSEYPDNWFLSGQDKTYLSDDIYLRRFGVELSFETDLVVEALANQENKVVFTLGISEMWSLVMEMSDSKIFHYKLVPNDDTYSEPIRLVETDSTVNQKIVFEYDFNSKLNLSVIYFVDGKSKGKTKYRAKKNFLPFKILTQDRLILNKTLDDLYCLGCLDNFRFIPDPLKTKSRGSHEYFIYSKDANTKHHQKEIELLAVSKHKTGKKKSTVVDLALKVDDSTICTVKIPSANGTFGTFLSIPCNQKLIEPQIDIIPLIYSSVDKSERRTLTIHKEFVLMLLIDRPWFDSGVKEYLGILTRENSNSKNLKVTNNCSSIGRDITRGTGAFREPLYSYLDKNLISRENFLTKYYTNSPSYKDNKITPKKISQDDIAQELLLLKPYYLKSKDKWITLLKFNMQTLTADSNSSFVSLVACRYQEKMAQHFMPLDAISDYTEPIITPLLGRREIEVECSKNKINLFVKNFGRGENHYGFNMSDTPDPIKMKKGSYTNKSIMIIFQGNKESNGFFEFKNVFKKTAKKNYHILKYRKEPDSFTISLKGKDVKDLFFVELETFSNTKESTILSLEKGIDNFFLFDDVRIVFVEKIKT